MFGIGIGEIFIIILIVFLISPKELPMVMKKIGQFFNEMNRLKREVMRLKKDVEDIVEEGKVDLGFIEEELPGEIGGKKKNIPKKTPIKKKPLIK